MRVSHLLVGLICATAAFGGSAQAASNFLTNGSFETGDFSGWTHSGNLGFTSIQSGGAQDGNFYADVGPVGSDGILSQTFADTAGQTLHVSGWIKAGGDIASDVSFIFNGAAGVSLTSPLTNGWAKYSFDTVGTGSDTFSVAFRDDPSFFGLDNFLVSTAVPEPATWAMFLIGFGAIGFMMRHLRRNGAATTA